MKLDYLHLFIAIFNTNHIAIFYEIFKVIFYKFQLCFILEAPTYSHTSGLFAIF